MSDNPAHEETISSERGFDGKLIHVRVDRVRMPSGRESVREVVEHPGAVSILALTESDEIILIRQWRHAVEAEMLEMPAGTREPGEDEKATARRELREETGYEAGEIEADRQLLLQLRVLHRTDHHVPRNRLHAGRA